MLAAIESAGIAADQLLHASRVSLASDSRWMVMLMPGRFKQVKVDAPCDADFANQFGAAYDAIFPQSDINAGHSAAMYRLQNLQKRRHNVVVMIEGDDDLSPHFHSKAIKNFVCLMLDDEARC